jgi:hypothetical protein
MSEAGRYKSIGLRAPYHRPMTYLEDAWAEVHDATPPGWYVGRPGYSDALKAWEQYAYVPAESRRGGGHHAHEWTALGQTEVEL